MLRETQEKIQALEVVWVDTFLTEAKPLFLQAGVFAGAGFALYNFAQAYYEINRYDKMDYRSIAEAEYIDANIKWHLAMTALGLVFAGTCHAYSA